METTNTQAGLNSRYVGGAVLVGAGALLLLAQFVDLGIYFLHLLSALFVLAGIATRQAGWFIPGGIIFGLAQGALIVETNQFISDQAEGGVFLLNFSLGWASIYLLSKLFTKQPQQWALIPSAIMAFIGAMVLIGEKGERLLELVFKMGNIALPLVLVAIGVYFLKRNK
jgi:hypothetical protein